MSTSFDLSLEQQFNIRSFEHQVQDMSHAQAQEFLVNLYKQMVLRENSYKNLLKHQWGIEEPNQQAA
jgi:Phycobilisome degradation protein nblA